jgi:hypothetical protein
MKGIIHVAALWPVRSQRLRARAENSLLASPNSQIPRQKFPVPLAQPI